jgi:serine protease AprX
VTRPTVWRNWVLTALADSPASRLDSEAAVLEEVAIRFADRFGPDDRNYRGEQPIWHHDVRQALAAMRSDKLLQKTATEEEPQVLTAAGRRQAAAVRAQVDAEPPLAELSAREDAGDGPVPLLTAGVIAPPLRLISTRRQVGFPERDDEPGAVMAELNLRFRGGPDAAFARLAELWARVTDPSASPGRPSTPASPGTGSNTGTDGATNASTGTGTGTGTGTSRATSTGSDSDSDTSTGSDSDRETGTDASGDPSTSGPDVVPPRRLPTPLGDEYATGMLSLNEMKRLVSADSVASARSRRCLRRIWPDFPIKEQTDASCITVKADAARRAFNAYGDRVVWAVIDSGIDATHPHFASYDTLRHESVADLHRMFPLEGEPDKDPELALVDESGHGTHVAGIIAGAIEPWLAKDGTRSVQATESRFNIEQPGDPLRMPRKIEDVSLLAGMAPKAKLVSLKVLQGGGTREARVARVMKALEYVREVNGESTESMRIHGVNLSLGYEFDPQWFACGQSPLCKEVDKLVRTGVVVVVAAGNSGYGTLAVLQDAPTRFGLGMTINDPGNAELAITVGSTHRDAPHSYGVSYFSSKGPTGDGRPKPDLVAPGERITSCAAGRKLSSVLENEVPAGTAVYVEDSGTSMAAPHVSGAIAALLSVRREFIGQPTRVKEIFTGSAISLRRHADFQGAGLLDLMRALQSQ